MASLLSLTPTEEEDEHANEDANEAGNEDAVDDTPPVTGQTNAAQIAPNGMGGAPMPNGMPVAPSQQSVTPRPRIQLLPAKRKRSDGHGTGSGTKGKKKLKVDPNFKANWGSGGHEAFYNKLNPLLRDARQTQDPNKQFQAKTKLEDLIQGMRSNSANRTLIHNKIRVASKKDPGMVTGTGMDELFKTAETDKFIEFSFKPPPGKSATSTFDGHEFDWMDVQRTLRLSTEAIVWAHDLCGTISGHTGTLQKEFRLKWMVKGQAAMHELRQAELEKRTTPANALMQAVSVHLELTTNMTAFTSSLFADASAKMPNGASLDDLHTLPEAIAALTKNRDKLKSLLQVFPQHAANPPGAHSPIRAHDQGGQPADASPLSGGNYTPLDMTAASANQPLQKLAPQLRVDWEQINAGLDRLGKPHGEIPKAPKGKKGKRKPPGASSDDDEE